ncbi:Glycerol-3-phosphate acyltransferase [Cyphellophora attinorum]|uniref:Glycerol-3-phosphate acyltransferase n=1 Tax=Cyphellophora attinorum TaxID=1664694 RepID=A0A0N1GZ02_9EURO|nr:Glycerol-3-phosphate acyltransferase [Phialophora attinorum]KPI36097.1 Glycerol-3-phosphate acyltransferase [Phialophora attinorum]
MDSDATLAPSTSNDASDGPDKSLVERMARFRKNPFNFAQELYLFVTGVGWRSYDRVIGQPCFYSGYTDNMKTMVMKSTILQKKLLDMTEARLRVEQEQNLLDADSPSYQQDREQRKIQIISDLVDITQDMLDNMLCKMENKIWLRTAYWGCTQLLTRAYSSIHVSEKEVSRLRAVAKIAQEQKRSLIFLPRHTSHIDYVSLHLVCYRLGLTLPVVVAGDNLNFPVVGTFLQTLGAMWLRRSFGDDALYPTLVQSYIDTMMQQGYNLECFIEGTRSRTGKLLGPKFGILSFYLDSLLSGRVKDAYIVPVSMQYDRVIEVDSFVTELLGKPKQKENLADFLSASSLLALNFGRIECRFHEPWSLRDFINEQQARIPNTTSPRESRTRILRTLGYRVLSDINDVSVVMPTALVGTVLLTLRGRGVGKAELVRRVEWLCERIRTNGGQVSDFQACQPLKCQSRIDRPRPATRRNMTIHLFISEALLAAGLYTRVKQGGGYASQAITEADLIDNVSFLSQLFRGEFIFPAGQGLRHNVEAALAGLLRDDVLTTSTSASPSSSTNSTSSSSDASPSRTNARTIGLSDTERALGRENFDFYCFMIWPFIDAAWLGAVSLFCLVPPAVTPSSPTTTPSPWVPMTVAQSTAQLFGRTLYHQGDLSYFESINKEALKNAYTRCQEEGIIIVSKSANSEDPKAAAVPMVRIAPEWLPQRKPTTGELIPEGRLWGFVERIGKHRREGKNRRDGATVGRRVLGLAETLGRENVFAVVGGADDTGGVPVKRRGRRTKL